MASPKSLQTLTLDLIEKNILLNLMNVIYTCENSSTVKLAEQQLDKITKELKIVLTQYVPNSLHNELSECLFAFILLLHSIIEDEEFLNYNFGNILYTWRMKCFLQNVSEKILDIVLKLYITKLSFSVIPPFHRKKAFLKICSLTQLQQLHISAKRTFFSNPHKYIENALMKLHNLKSFSYRKYCSDNIIAILAINCKNLLHIEVTGSENVTNNSIDHILELPKLRELQIQSTKIDKNGYIRLLLEHTSLHNIEIVSNIGDILEEIDDTTENATFNLLHIQSADITTKHLKLIEKFCPHLVSLHIQCTNANFSVLEKMPNLKDLLVHDINFYEDGLDKFISKIGKNMEQLIFTACKNIDYNAIVIIAKNCRNLNMLRFDRCVYDPFFNIVETVPKQILKNLKFLEFYGNIPEKCYSFLLSRCFNIKRLVLAHMGEELNDQSFDSILRENPMSMLETVVLASDNLSVNVIENWINEYKSIKYLCVTNELFLKLEENGPHERRIPIKNLGSGIVFPFYVKKWFDREYMHIAVEHIL